MEGKDKKLRWRFVLWCGIALIDEFQKSLEKYSTNVAIPLTTANLFYSLV
jgi:hypothetical protein